MEVTGLINKEQRFTIALVAEGNLLDRVLRAAPMFDQLERSMNSESDTPTRFDLRLYREHGEPNRGTRRRSQGAPGRWMVPCVRRAVCDA